MNKKSDLQLNLPHELEFASTRLYGAVVDIKIKIGTEKDLTIRIIPKNDDAAEITIVCNKMLFGLSVGRFVEIDLEELDEQVGSKFIAAAMLVRDIIQYGLYESALVLGDKKISWKCIIPAPGNPAEFRHDSIVLPRTRKKAETKEYKYASYFT
jgi:hypothetical protein